MPAAKWATRAVSVVVVLLTMIGITATIFRVMFPTDLIQREGPIRADILAAFRIDDPLAAERTAELARMDRPFAEHRALTLLHIVPGALFFALAPLQFSERVRSRHVNLHRWSGRSLLVVGTIALLPGLFFGIVMPFGGPLEAVMIAAAGIWFLYSMTSAFMAIRRRDIVRHREWMIRMFATALAISTVRLIGGPLDVLLTPYAVAASDLFVLAIWMSWVMTIGLAECWIRYTRRSRAQI